MQRDAIKVYLRDEDADIQEILSSVDNVSEWVREAIREKASRQLPFGSIQRDDAIVQRLDAMLDRFDAVVDAIRGVQVVSVPDVVPGTVAEDPEAVARLDDLFD